MSKRLPLIVSLSCLAAGALAVGAGASSEATGTLIGKVGPGFDITLKTPAGKTVSTVRAGTYTFRITDRTGDDAHNFHLKGAGVDMATTVRFVGSKTWTVRLQKGKTYRFVCDPHVFVMKGSFKVT